MRTETVDPASCHGLKLPMLFHQPLQDRTKRRHAMSSKTVPVENNPTMVTNSEESGTPSSHRSGPRKGAPGGGVGRNVMRRRYR